MGLGRLLFNRPWLGAEKSLSAISRGHPWLVAWRVMSSYQIRFFKTTDSVVVQARVGMDMRSSVSFYAFHGVVTIKTVREVAAGFAYIDRYPDITDHLAEDIIPRVIDEEFERPRIYPVFVAAGLSVPSNFVFH